MSKDYNEILAQIQADMGLLDGDAPIAYLRTDGAEDIEVYVLGLCDEPKEGDPDDLKLRPTKFGPGPYTLVTRSTDVFDAEGRVFSFEAAPSGGMTL